ncbi:MAG: molybdopterin-guanine dinucleotide biosynthesis protein MobA [Variovorax sp.]|nr:molybdopterin-guanine dinucleotide biosynthesis protein MobA [Variovorax sp.]
MHKLDALIAGRSVRERTLDAVRASGLPWHMEVAGHPGMGDSISAAVTATPDAHGWLILPADLPLTTAATLQRVAAALAEAGGEWKAVQPACRGIRGHPVGFAASSGGALKALGGEKGAGAILKTLRAEGAVCELETDDIGVITDIDTLADLAAAEALWISSSR